MEKNIGYRITPNSNPLFDKNSNIMFSWYPTYKIKGNTSNDLKTIIDKVGTNVFVDLTTKNEYMLSYEDFVRDIMPLSIIIKYPIKYKGIPKDWNSFMLLIKNIISLFDDGNKILIHSRGGHGRSALVAACVLINLGFTSDEALQQIKKMHMTREYIPNHSCPETNEQIDFIKTYEKLLLN